MPPMASGDGIGGGAVPKSKFAGIMMAGFASFGGILYGYDTGVINGVKVMPKFLETFGDRRDANGNFSLSSGKESLFVSILSAGTFAGALIGGPTSDILGRRWGVAFGCIWFCLGVGLQLGTSDGLFIAGRVFAGVGVGIISVLVPMYQSECSPKWIRGAVVGAYQWAITIGILLAACVNEGTKDNTSLSAYRIPIGIQFAWAAILVSGMLCLPESPRWLIKKGRDADAAHALGRLVALPADDPMVTHELDLIRANLDAELALGEHTYLDCFKSGPTKIRLRTLTGIFIQAWQQLTGINFIFYYGTTFFTNSGIENPFTISIITNVVNVVTTLPGMWGIERFGRRRLLLVGAAGMLVCEFLVAIIGVSIGIDNKAGQKALIAFVCIYIAFFASTWGPIAWVITGEIFPLAVRAKAMSMSVASNWLWNFGIGYATPYLVNSGEGNANLGVKVFFIWGGTCTGCLIFTYFCVPETKGLSLEEIDELYRHTTPIHSVAYRRRLLAEGRELSDVDKTGDVRHEKTKTMDSA